MTAQPDFSERIATLRSRCLDRKTTDVCRERRPWSAKALQATEGRPWILRKGACCREILSNTRLDIDDLELLIGRIKPGWLPFTPAEIKAAATYLAKYPSPPGLSDGHCEHGKIIRFAVSI